MVSRYAHVAPRELHAAVQALGDGAYYEDGTAENATDAETAA